MWKVLKPAGASTQLQFPEKGELSEHRYRRVEARNGILVPEGGRGAVIGLIGEGRKLQGIVMPSKWGWTQMQGRVTCH